MNLSTLAASCAQARPNKAHIALPLLMMAALYWLSSVPGIPLPDDSAHYALFYWVPPAVQNILHVPVYAALALACHWALGAWRTVSGVRAIAAGAVASAYGILDEWHQSFVPGRYGSFTDVALDVAGVGLGLWLASWMSQYAANRAAANATRNVQAPLL